VAPLTLITQNPAKKYADLWSRALVLNPGGSEKPGFMDGHYLSKPIKQSHLFNSLLMIKSGHEENSHLQHAGIITKHFVDEIASDRYRILVVEDNRINQKLMAGFLNRLKIHCDVAENGKIAVDSFEKQKYDLILMDCQMPVMNGYEATRTIRKQEKNGSHIPIIALTADVLSENQDQCLAAGMDDYFTKPFDPEKLKKMLKKYLEKEE